MRTLFLSIMVTAILIAGCSSSNPTSPENEVAQADSYSATGILGAYEVSVDTVSKTADIVPKRETKLGESYLVSGMGFFDVAPCPDCVAISGLWIDDVNELVTLQFHIRHPFAAGNPAEPPSAANRSDLSVFDLAAVIHPQDVTPTLFALTGTDCYASPMGDGLTIELADVVGDEAALPFSLVVDESAETSHTYNEFAQGAEADFDVEFSLGLGETLVFDMYLMMGYGASATKPTRLTPTYFNPEFNSKPAWKVDVTLPDPTWSESDTVTELPVIVAAYDWQQGAAVYSGDDYSTASPSEVYAASEVESVSLEILGMFSALKEMTIADSGTGMPTDPLIYTFMVANENGLAAGTYYGCVKVTDSRAVGTIGDRDFLIHTDDGINLLNFEIPEYATYQVFEAVVEAE